VDAYRPVLIFTVSLLLALSFCRVLLITMHWDRVDAVDGLFFVLTQGVRFDLIITCALVLPAALLSPFLCNRPTWLKVMHVYLVSAFSLAIFMEAATPTFISEYDQRPNILFVEYLKYPKEVASMLLGGYKLDILLALTAVFVVCRLFARCLVARTATS
jgi:phosphoglycerol transferase MdoB-like AlkP superfamily enzyme